MPAMRKPSAWEGCQNGELDVKGRPLHVPIKRIWLVVGLWVKMKYVKIYIVAKLQLPTSRGVSFRIPSSRGNQHIMEDKKPYILNRMKNPGSLIVKNHPYSRG